jgi:membrane-anchored protein YejM (alkaline phosphatase superfamily)
MGAGALVASLLVVHELLLWRARPLKASEEVYLQAVVLAQCAWVLASLTIAMALVPRFRRPLFALAFTLAPLLYVDSLVFLRVDRHLPSVAALLFDARLEENTRLLAATGIDFRVVLPFLAALVALVAVAARLTPPGGLGARLEARMGWRALAGAWLASIVVLGGLEAGASYTVPANVWSRFARSVPQLLGALGPAPRAKATLRAALRPLPSDSAVDRALGQLSMPAAPPSGDIFFFVVESLRADAIDPKTTPAMAALAGDALPIRTAVSGGNVTQYGWFSLFTSRPALYWDRDEQAAERVGATPIRIARRRGFRVEALTSNDLTYMHIDQTLFGASHALADDFFDASPTPGAPAAHDQRVMAELTARLARTHPPTLYIVSLDATHLPYGWTEDFTPPWTPFAGEGHYLRTQTTAADRLAVQHRYRDAVSFVDSLLGTFVLALRASGAYERATIVVAGDHGEEFWEHEVATHGTEACSVQTHITLIIELARDLRPAPEATATIALASSIDVWPTLLDAAGVAGDTTALFAGKSLLRGPTGAALATHQRFWYRPGLFALDDGQEKVTLELTDPDHPFRMQEMRILDFFDEADAPTHGHATPEECRRVAKRAFGPDLERFFELRW